MSQVCPISGKMVNERVARLNALFVFFACSAFILLENAWLFYVLGADFFLRGFISPKCSPVAVLNVWLLNALGIKPQMTDAARKVFAARVGFLFCVIVVLFEWAGKAFASVIFAGALGFFAGLEAFLGFCLACQIYPLIFRFKRPPEPT